VTTDARGAGNPPSKFITHAVFFFDMLYQNPSDWAACPVCDGREVETTVFSDGVANLACDGCGHAETVELDPVVR